MQKIEKYKTQKLSRFNQLVILNDDGYIEDSCNSIFSTESFRNKPFTLYFPFLESVFPNLLDLSVDSKELRFAKIESPLEELPGVYDFTFARVLLDEKKYILWSIYDYTALYEDFKQYQQKRNELEIHREMLESRNRKLHRQKDLIAQKHLVLENWNQIRKDYYNKVRLALQSPINALDGLSFILANLPDEKTDGDYISALRASVKHLQNIIAEFELLTTVDGEKQMSQIHPFQPQEIIDKVLEDLTQSPLDPSISITTTIAEDLPQQLLGNPRHLYQILHQLLQNTQKHLKPNHLELHITGQLMPALAVKQWLMHLRISEKIEPGETLPLSPVSPTKDPEAAKDLIFRLSLVKKLIELDGGSIQVENRSAQAGFTIECKLPYPLFS